MHMQYVFVCVGIMYILHDSVHVWFQCKISISLVTEILMVLLEHIFITYFARFGYCIVKGF